MIFSFITTLTVTYVLIENFCPYLKIISFPNFLPVRQYTLLSAAEVIANIRRINRDTEIQDLEVSF